MPKLSLLATHDIVFHQAKKVIKRERSIKVKIQTNNGTTKTIFRSLTLNPVFFVLFYKTLAMTQDTCNDNLFQVF